MGHSQNFISLQEYVACAVYYEESDSLEYVRSDVPNIYHRVDDLLTLIYSMDDRKIIGFKLKGFRHFYLRHFENDRNSEPQDFLQLVKIVEEALGSLGNEIFDEQTRVAYQRAIDIAQKDQVEVRDLPRKMHA